MDKEIDIMLREQIIEPSRTSLVVIIRRRIEELRIARSICVDYCRLNVEMYIYAPY